jgi:hypothetical protein
MKLLNFLVGATASLSVFNSYTFQAQAATFTLGQSNAVNGIPLRGQGFIPDAIGDQGTGSAPASGNVTLDSWTFVYQSPGSSSITENTLYIYDSLPTVTDLNSGIGALYTSNGTIDLLVNDPFFGAGLRPSRTWTFTGAVLDVNTTYFALLPSNQTIRVATSSYPTTAYGTNLAAQGTLDTGFRASLTQVPFEFSPIFGLTVVGGVYLTNKFRKKLIK